MLLDMLGNDNKCEGDTSMVNDGEKRKKKEKKRKKKKRKMKTLCRCYWLCWLMTRNFV